LPESEAMDRDNNRLGMEIGSDPDTNSWAEVVRQARQSINPFDPNGDQGGARWLPEDYWTQNPREAGPDSPRIPTYASDGDYDPRLNCPRIDGPYEPVWPQGPVPLPPRTPTPPSGNYNDNYDQDGNYDLDCDDDRPPHGNFPPSGPAPLPRLDPLVLDLDGDGIQTINVKAGTYFDHEPTVLLSRQVGSDLMMACFRGPL